MAIYRILWKDGNAQAGFWSEIDRPTVAEAAWYVATSLAGIGQDGTHAPPVFVHAAEIGPDGQPVTPPPAALPGTYCPE